MGERLVGLRHLVHILFPLESATLIVVGGGEFANLIRKYDGDVGFSEDVTHETAIDCMDIISKLVCDKVPSAKLAYSIDEVLKIAGEGLTPIFVVSEFLKEDKLYEFSNYSEYLCTIHQKIQQKMDEY